MPHRHEDEHHGDAELQPVGEAQPHLGGGDGIGGAAHQGADTADAGAVGDRQAGRRPGWRRSLLNIEPLASMPRASGIIMAAVAVLLIHMEMRGRDGEQHYGAPSRGDPWPAASPWRRSGYPAPAWRGPPPGRKPPKKRKRIRVGEVSQRLAHVKHPEQGGEHRDGPAAR